MLTSYTINTLCWPCGRYTGSCASQSEVRPYSQNCGCFHPTGVCCSNRKSNKVTVVLHFCRGVVCSLEKACAFQSVTFPGQDTFQFLTYWANVWMSINRRKLLIYMYCCSHFLVTILFDLVDKGGLAEQVTALTAMSKCRGTLFLAQKHFNHACQIFFFVSISSVKTQTATREWTDLQTAMRASPKFWWFPTSENIQLSVTDVRL